MKEFTTTRENTKSDLNEPSVLLKTQKKELNSQAIALIDKILR